MKSFIAKCFGSKESLLEFSYRLMGAGHIAWAIAHFFATLAKSELPPTYDNIMMYLINFWIGLEGFRKSSLIRKSYFLLVLFLPLQAFLLFPEPQENKNIHDLTLSVVDWTFHGVRFIAGMLPLVRPLSEPSCCPSLRSCGTVRNIYKLPQMLGLYELSGLLFSLYQYFRNYCSESGYYSSVHAYSEELFRASRPLSSLFPSD